MSNKIKVYILKKEAFHSLNVAYKDVYKNILNNPKDTKWLKNIYNKELYEETEYYIDDFDVMTSGDNFIEKNAINLYNSVSKLPNNILTDVKFWIWILFEKFYEYAQNLIPVEEGIVKNLWLCQRSSRRTAMLHVIGREFFKVALSIDESSNDKYRLTNYLVNSTAAIYESLVYRNISDIKAVSYAYLDAQYRITKEMKIRITSSVAKKLMVEVSNVGSVKLIDVIDREELSDIIYDRLNEIIMMNYMGE